MNTDNLKQICDEALTKLAAALEAGHSDALKTYLSTMGRIAIFAPMVVKKRAEG